MKPELLICGYSFSTEHESSWASLLLTNFNITNLSQAGCSEYKIYRQLMSVDVQKYDNVLISHTSPNRIYVAKHPVHRKDSFHENSCLIYTDIKEHEKLYPEVKSISEYFEKYFDFEYANHIHNLLIKDIEKICPKNTLHISHIQWSNLHQCRNWLNFKKEFKEHCGSAHNHYTILGNKIVYNTIYNKLKELYDN